MNTILRLAGVMAPAAAMALLAGGVCPPEAGHESSRLAAGMTGTVALPAGALGAASLALGATQPAAQVRTHIKVVQQDDTGAYELVIENGQPRAKINGEAVPSDRISEREDGVWVIEDESGEVVARFHIGRAPAVLASPGAPAPAAPPKVSRDLAPGFQDLPRIRELAPSGEFMVNVETHAQQPKTMLGVVMAPAPDGAEGGGVLIERVIDDLPAARAGLKGGDIITGIEGAARVTPESLRTLLRGKEPGEELKLRVLRDGEEKALTVRLEAFDSEKLVQPPSLAMDALRATPGPSARSLGGLSGEARRQMEGAMRALREAEQFASGEAKVAHEHALEAIEQFVGALERMEAEGLSTGEAMRGDLGRWFGQFKDDQMVWGDKPGMVFTLPRNNLQFDRRDGRDANASGADGNAETGAGRIRKEEDVEARLNAMADRLERIEKLLEKLAADGSDRQQ